MGEDNFLYNFKLLNQELFLLPQKAIYWKEKEILIFSDLHLGKASHFRKAGIPIPLQVHKEDYLRLEGLLGLYKPKEIIFLGDLFHSSWNHEWKYFKNWCDKNRKIKLHLVAGNHDILPEYFYEDCDLQVHKKTLTIPPFIFSHEPITNFFSNKNLYNISGHVHPGVRLSGAGRQKIVLPCFHFKPKQAILPAFGNFTGCITLRADAGDKVFIVTNQRVILV
jgi:uncharacterized protein